MNSKYFLGTAKATNDTGELTAICEGLLWLKDYETSNRTAAVYSGSKYAAKIATGEYTLKNNKFPAATTRTILKKVIQKRKGSPCISKCLISGLTVTNGAHTNAF